MASYCSGDTLHFMLFGSVLVVVVAAVSAAAWVVAEAVTCVSAAAVIDAVT